MTIANVLNHEDAGLIIITTSTGLVLTISPVHPAYATIRTLATTRRDDEKLLELASKTLKDAEFSNGPRRLFQNVRYDTIKTDAKTIWMLDYRVPDPIAQEFAFLAQNESKPEAHKHIDKLRRLCFALMNVNDQNLAETIAKLYARRLIHIDRDAHVYVQPWGIGYIASTPTSSDLINVSEIRSIRRKNHLFITRNA